MNETHYPDDFAKNALEICEEEYPYPYSIAACDHGASGDQYYSLLLRPIESKLQPDKTYFIREWGDNVDDWNAQNSDSRVARGLGRSADVDPGGTLCESVLYKGIPDSML
mgnify:CR=1 FL=1